MTLDSESEEHAFCTEFFSVNFRNILLWLASELLSS